MRLFGLFTIGTVAVLGKRLEPGYHYNVSGWESWCDKMPESCANEVDDVVELNNCLVDRGPLCENKLDVRVSMRSTDRESHSFFQFARTDINQKTFMMKVSKPLFPGGWKLSSGTIRTKGILYPYPNYGIELEGRMIVFKEGTVDKFKDEDLNQWTPIDCHIGPAEWTDIEFIEHKFTCSDKTPELLKNATTVNFVILEQYYPVLYGGWSEPTGELVFKRTTKASHISSVTADTVLYSIQWGTNCNKNVEKDCVPEPRTGLTYEDVSKCLKVHREPECEISLETYMTGELLNPVELRIKGVDTLVEGVYIDPAEIFFTDDIDPPINWKINYIEYAFPAHTEDSNIYVSHNLGDFSGKLDERFIGAPKERQLFKNGFDINSTRGTFVYLDRPIKDNRELHFVGTIALKQEAATPTTPTTTTTHKSTSEAKPASTIPTPNPNLGITILDREHAEYLISWGNGCTTAPTWCKKRLTYLEVEKCLVYDTLLECSIKLNVFIPKANKAVPFKPVATNIDGRQIESPVVFFDPSNLFLSSSIWKKASLEAFSFDLSGKADLYVSHQFGGNPATGKVLNQVELKADEQFKASIPIQLTGGQYIYLKHEYHTAGVFSAVFTVSEY